MCRHTVEFCSLSQWQRLHLGEEAVQKTWNLVSIWTNIKLEIHRQIQYVLDHLYCILEISTLWKLFTLISKPV